MTSAWSQLEQMLTCAICLDKFKNPRLLPCQHSFCGDACMDGLVDYARRQIKCPECRAEHRIPYQGVQSLPLNVTLIRFLELHARITGEEPEPVPTFLEKCSICGEKVEGVQRCSHCEKKVCPECKEAHIDLLRREIGRLNGQTKRSLSKMQEFKETLKKSEDKLAINQATVKHEIENSCKRLIEDLKTKQQKLIEEVDQFAEQEQKTIDKLKVAIVDEHSIISGNLHIAEEKFIPTSDSVSGCRLSWQDGELSELKDIYNKSMEFVRLFDPEIGDFVRKIRFTLIPEFENLRKRICDLGELKFSESAAQSIANSLQYCNASGQVAQDLCQQAAAQQKQKLERQPAGGYGLAHSNSNSNLGHQFAPQSSSGVSLELPNALMRSQSDHRLASQFQQRLKAQEMASKNNGANGGGSSRYGSRAGDYDSDIRSRYAPPRGTKDYSSDLLRDWPRPSDADGPDYSSSIHFKSAFMRRKEKERYGGSGGSAYGSALDDDDDLTSEASYSTSGRNVRFYDQQQQGQDPGATQLAAKFPRQFDLPEVERAPLSGVPKLDSSPHYHNRLQQMGARSKVEKKEREEQGAKDKDLVESARQAMSKVAAKALAQRQLSEDEIEKQKRANKLQDQQRQEEVLSETITGANRGSSASTTVSTQAATAAATATTTASSVAGVTDQTGSGESTPTTPSVSSLQSGRRSLYGQAVTERSRRQLSSAMQNAADYARQRSTAATDSLESPTAGGSADPSEPGVLPTKRRVLRSGSRSLSKRSSIERQQSVDSASGGGTPSSSSSGSRRRRTLAREDSSAHQSGQDQPATSAGRAQTATASKTASESKNLHSGSGASGASESQEDLPAGHKRTFERRVAPPSSAAGQTPTTTDDEDDDDDDEDNENTGTIRRRAQISRQSTAASSAAETTSTATSVPTARRFVPSLSQSRSLKSGEEGESERRGGEAEAEEDGNADEAEEEEEEADDSDSRGGKTSSRLSRELLPSAMNRLLDRSAQIRRDSQEQRSRGDSPQRSVAPKVSTTAASTRADYTSGSSASSYYSPASALGTSSASSPVAVRQRYGFQQRPFGSRQDSKSVGGAHEADSSSSVYTTASSQRRSSTEDSNEHLSGAHRHQSGGSSSERTLVGASEAPLSTRYSSKRDSSATDSSPSRGSYQSRFLARSRTSAALSEGGSGERSSPRYQDDYRQGQRSSEQERDQDGNNSDSPASLTRSYLSSRDRFMQSTAMLSPSSSAGGSGARDRTSATTSGSGGASSAGKFTNLLAWRSKLRARLTHSPN